MIVQIANADLETKYGLYREYLYYDGQKESIAIVHGDVTNGESILCRIHSHCISAHVFNSIECDCREQMEISQKLIESERKGIIIWLDQEGRGNGHMAKLQSAKLKQNGTSQSEAYSQLGYDVDSRKFIRAAEILADLKVCSIKLLSNNPKKKEDIEKSGVQISSVIPVKIQVDDNKHLQTSYEDKLALGHTL